MWDAALLQHRAMLAKLMQRIDAYPTPTERRANRFDPVAHPVQFKRTEAGGAGRREDKSRGGRKGRVGSAAALSGGEGGVGGSAAAAAELSMRVERDILYSTGATRSQRYFYADPFSTRLKPRQDYDSALLITQQMHPGHRRGSRPPTHTSAHTAQQRRPSTASDRAAKHSLSRTTALHRGDRRGEEEKGGPRGAAADTSATRSTSSTSSTDSSSSSSSSTSPYSRLHSVLLQLLVAHRLYRAESVEELLQRAVEVNDHLDRAKVGRVCDAVRAEMDMKREDSREEARQKESTTADWWSREEDSDSDKGEDWQEEEEQEEEEEGEDGEERLGRSLDYRAGEASASVDSAAVRGENSQRDRERWSSRRPTDQPSHTQPWPQPQAPGKAPSSPPSSATASAPIRAQQQQMLAAVAKGAPRWDEKGEEAEREEETASAVTGEREREKEREGSESDEERYEEDAYEEDEAEEDEAE